jgi:hypothetical protein
MDTLEEKKQDLMESLILLKKDVETVEQMISYIENQIDSVKTEEDVENFDANIKAFEHKLEIIEIF